MLDVIDTSDINKQYCVYYQAIVPRQHVWFFVAILRSFDHVAFDRTYDVANSIFEFFVPPAMEPYFLEIIEALHKEGVVENVEKKPNRLLDSTEVV